MSTVTEQQSRHGQVQSLIFSKDHFTRDEALAWAKEHDFKAGKVHETENSYRLRQFDPGACESFRSKKLTTGVTAVICLTGETLYTKEEAFNWLAPIEADDNLNLPPFSVKIVALHAGMTRNLTEYAEDELIRGARTFIDQPIYFGTSHSPEDKEPVGHIYWAEEEDRQLELLGHIPLAPALWQQIRDGEISQGSVELGCLFLPPILGGHACRKLVGRGFLITPPGVELGDPETHIEVVETLTRLGETLATSETQSQSQDSGQKETRMGKEEKDKNLGENAELVQQVTETVQKTFDEKISGIEETFNKKVDEILGSLEKLKEAGESLENRVSEFIDGDFKQLNGRVETLESSRPSRRTFSEAHTRQGGGRGLVEANAAATEEPKTSVSFADIQLGEVLRRKG
ncbi:MAG: hypothetical protein ACE5IB_05180 [Candidatus Geothermarchaeales archaeon]